MPSETEVIACPACRHLLRVPADWLGQTVQCPECKATFRAPVRDGDRLTEPELIAGRALWQSAGPPAHKHTDAAMWLPAFGLMLVGVVSVIVNTYTLAVIAQNPAGFEESIKGQIEEALKRLGQPPPAGGAKNPAVRWPVFAAMTGWCLLCGTVSFLGGLGITLRRWRRLAQVGCITATLNIAGCCCVPGALFGVWGLLMLMSEEGRSHFV
jgi:hypothetical protein